MKALSGFLKTISIIFIFVVLLFAIFTVFFGQNIYAVFEFVSNIGYWIFDFFVTILTFFKDFFVGLKTPTV